MPFIGSVGAKFFHKSSMEEVAAIKDIGNYFDRAEYIRWKSFRETDDARYIGLTMPRVLARLPYGAATVPVKGFAFEEEIDGKHDHYVWMNAAFAMGVNINRSHKLYGWGTQIRGVESGGTVMNLPVHTFPTDDGSVAMKCPTEISITDRREAIRTACMMAEKGDVVLVAGKGHETYQEINGVKHHFDDREEVRRAFETLLR